MNKANQLAKEYADEQNDCYTNDYNGYLNGFNRGEKETIKEIKEQINILRETEKVRIDEFTLNLIENYLNAKTPPTY